MAVTLCGCCMVCVEKCGIQCGIYGVGRQGVAKAKILCGDKGNGGIGKGQRGAVYTRRVRRELVILWIQYGVCKKDEGKPAGC